MAATFPYAIKIFTVFHDYTDIVWAHSINECHDEIQALEKIIGPNPFASTPYATMSAAIQDLYHAKAPSNHTHIHHSLQDDTTGNDHPQYIQVTGYPGFSRPVSGVAGGAPSDLVPLSQLQSLGYQNASQVQNAVNAATANLMAGAHGGTPLLGASASTAWRITGGVFSGCTGPTGQVTVPFGLTYGQVVQAFSCTKLPPAAGGTCPGYNWIEAQMTLVSVSGNSALVQFSHDYSWQAGMWVTFSWIVMGI